MSTVPKNLFMAWSGSEVPLWAKQSFQEYQDVLGKTWTYEFFTDFQIPIQHRLKPWLDRLDFAVYKADVFRLWLLETYGGVWVDTDTRIIRDLSPLLLYGNGFATVHRTCSGNALDSFHIDSCIIGQNKNGLLSETVINRATSSTEKLNKFRFGFRKYLTGNCPEEIMYGPYDEMANKEEQRQFLDLNFSTIVPKRNNSYIRHYLTNFYNNKI